MARRPPNLVPGPTATRGGEPRVAPSRRLRLMLLWSLPALLFWAGVAAWAVETGGLPPSSPFIFLGLAIQLLQFAGMAQLAREERELKRRFHQGACLSCGYDLRATPGRCPECGALAAPTSPVAPGGKW